MIDAGYQVLEQILIFNLTIILHYKDIMYNINISESLNSVSCTHSIINV